MSIHNNVPFFAEGRTGPVGANVMLPSNLANFRDVTMSDRDKRERRCEIIGIILNYYLGWYVDNESHGIALSATRTQHEIEKLNSIGPLKYTATFRLSPGEAKRVADRLQYTPLVFKENGRYWSRNLRNVKATADLIKPIGATPSVIINKFKHRGSRSNYTNSKTICVNENFWGAIDALEWIRLLNPSNTYGNGRDKAYDKLRITDLIERRSQGSTWRYQNSGYSSENIRFHEYAITSFCADLFNFLKESLTIRRNTPEIIHSDEEDFVQLRDFLEAQSNEIVRSNALLKDLATVTDGRVIKARESLWISYQIKLHEPSIHIKHPSGEIRYSDYVRNIQDIRGNNADFYMGIQVKLTSNIANSNFTGTRARLMGYTEILHTRPNLYNTSNANSPTAVALINAFEGVNGNGNEFSSEAFQSNNCFSEHERGIYRAANRLDYLTLCMNLLNWHQVYVPGRTQPYEHPGKVFFGIGANIPDWYKSLHDSSASACETFITNNYGDVNADGIGINCVSNENLKELALNHCGTCFHRNNVDRGHDKCLVFSRSLEHNWNGVELDYLAELGLKLDSKDSKEVEVCTPIEVEEPILVCLHDIPLNSNCGRCRTDPDVVTIQGEVIIEEEPLDPGVIAIEDTREELTNAEIDEAMEPDQQRIMDLMAGWVQSER